MIASDAAAVFYNDHSKQYSDSKLLPFRFIESFNFLLLVKSVIPVSNCTHVILDVACGDGFYTRKVKDIFGDKCKVIGVDISENMVALAKEMTSDSLEIDYICHDGAMLMDTKFREKISNILVDNVCCAFFLNYASNRTELIQYLKSVNSVLKPGGYFFGLNDNPHDDPSWYNQDRFKDLGFDKYVTSTNRVEGQPVIYKIYNKDGSIMEIKNYWIHPKTIEEVFKFSGFVEFEWIDMANVPQDVLKNDSCLNGIYQKYGKKIDQLVKTAPTILFKAKKSIDSTKLDGI